MVMNAKIIWNKIATHLAIKIAYMVVQFLKKLVKNKDLKRFMEV